MFLREKIVALGAGVTIPFTSWVALLCGEQIATLENGETVATLALLVAIVSGLVITTTALTTRDWRGQRAVRLGLYGTLLLEPATAVFGAAAGSAVLIGLAAVLLIAALWGRGHEPESEDGRTATRRCQRREIVALTVVAVLGSYLYLASALPWETLSLPTPIVLGVIAIFTAIEVAALALRASESSATRSATKPVQPASEPIDTRDVESRRVDTQQA